MKDKSAITSLFRWKAPAKGKIRFSFFMLSFAALLLSSCAISYKFNGASIDYQKTKTIQIDPFPIRSAYVWAPMQSIFNNKLTDIYAQQAQAGQAWRRPSRGW